jgi:hypothetical protein
MLDPRHSLFLLGPVEQRSDLTRYAAGATSRNNEREPIRDGRPGVAALLERWSMGRHPTRRPEPRSKPAPCVRAGESSRSLAFALAELGGLPAAAVVVEGRYSDLYKVEHVQPGWLPEALARLQIAVCRTRRSP